MIELETALIHIINTYGYRDKYLNIRLNYQGNIQNIINQLTVIPCYHKKIYIGYRFTTWRFTYTDGSKVWIGVDGGLLWRFNFTPENDCLLHEVNGRGDKEQYQAINKVRV